MDPYEHNQSLFTEQRPEFAWQLRKILANYLNLKYNPKPKIDSNIEKKVANKHEFVEMILSFLTPMKGLVYPKTWIPNGLEWKTQVQTDLLDQINQNHDLMP